MQFNTLVNTIDGSLPASPFARPHGSLLIMVGLPGAGKSSIVEQMAAWCDFVVIQTDGIRKQLDNSPAYSMDEMASVYDICYALVARRLRAGQRVIFDASNYLQARRQRAMDLATLEGSAMAMCRVQASQTETYQRLMAREQAKGGTSDAGWAVYQWMVENQEPLTVPHLIIDSSVAPIEQSARRLYEFWMEHEQSEPFSS